MSAFEAEIAIFELIFYEHFLIEIGIADFDRP
jgi:hypothetical protein